MPIASPPYQHAAVSPSRAPASFLPILHSPSDIVPDTFSIDWRMLPTMTDAVQMAGWTWRGIVVWDKTNGCRPQLSRFRSQAEYVVWASRGAIDTRAHPV